MNVKVSDFLLVILEWGKSLKSYTKKKKRWVKTVIAWLGIFTL